MKITHALVTACTLLLSACGGIDSLLGLGSCGSSGGSCVAPANAGCVESNLPSAAVMAACTNGGMYNSSACTRTSAVGTCQKTVAGTCQTTVLYAPLTVDAARTACAQMQGTFSAL